MNRKRSRRSLARLTEFLVGARSVKGRALAHYRLGLFHDNNSREAEAIPHYRKAIALGLPRPIEAQAHAWLASSLYKTGYPAQAIKNLRKAAKVTTHTRLQRFLRGLELRISRRRNVCS